MRPQDILLLMKIALLENSNWTVGEIARAVGVSQPEASLSLTRSVRTGLLSPSKKSVSRKSLLEFLQFGVRYVFPVSIGPMTRGIPTAHSAAPLTDRIASGGEEFVWPKVGGPVRGQAVKPLYPTVPDIVTHDVPLHEALALIDAIRIGRPREVEIAVGELKQRLKVNS